MFLHLISKAYVYASLSRTVARLPSAPSTQAVLAYLLSLTQSRLYTVEDSKGIRFVFVLSEFILWSRRSGFLLSGATDKLFTILLGALEFKSHSCVLRSQESKFWAWSLSRQDDVLSTQRHQPITSVDRSVSSFFCRRVLIWVCYATLWRTMSIGLKSCVWVASHVSMC